MNLGKYQITIWNPFEYRQEEGRELVIFEIPRFYKQTFDKKSAWHLVFEWWYHWGYISIRKWKHKPVKALREE